METLNVPVTLPVHMDTMKAGGKVEDAYWLCWTEMANLQVGRELKASH